MVHKPAKAKRISVQGIELKEPDFSQLKCDRPLLDPYELLRIKEDEEIAGRRHRAPDSGGGD
jgi:hypothetical protein